MKRATILRFQLLLLCATGTVQAAGEGEETLTLQNSPQPQTSPQSETLRDIHGPLPTVDYPSSLLLGAGTLVLILLIALLVYFLKRRKKPGPPPIPPWEAALQELAEAHHLISGGQSLRYMDQAGQILRRYIELRFTIRSTRQTTREFFAGLKDTDRSPLVACQAELRACLEQADMAKFAHLAADQSHMQQMEEAVRTFITRTRPETPPTGVKP